MAKSNEEIVQESTKTAVEEALKESGLSPDGTAGGEGGGTPEGETEPETPAGETEPEKPAAEKVEKEPAKPAKPEGEEKPTFYKPTAAQLDAIDKSPELKAVYRSMLRHFHSANEENANSRKEGEAAIAAVKAIKDNPVETIKAMAIAAGIKLAPEDKSDDKKTEKSRVDVIKELLEKRIGKDAADILAPSLEEAVASITREELAKEIGPVKQSLAAAEKTANDQLLANGISAFGAQVVEDGGEWDEDLEKEMADLVLKGKVQPGPETTLPEFLDILHSKVLMSRRKSEELTRRTERLRHAAEDKEPVTPKRPSAAPSPVIKPGMNEKDAVNLAVELAQKELAGKR